jgi:hypothetical protein
VLSSIARPVYVHSLHGRRAAAMLIIHLALYGGMAADPAVEEGRRLGIAWNGARLLAFARSEVNGRLPSRRLSPG